MSALKGAIGLLDPAPDKKKQITLLLSLLSELCEQKVVEFSTAIETELRTAGSVENKTIPVTEILAKHKEYRAYISEDAGKIADEVTEGISNFLSNPSGNEILTGIGKLVTTGLKAIIGSGTGNQQELSSYFVIVQSYALLRFDIRVWSRKIEAEGITEKIEHAFAISAYKSSVDLKKISLNTFLLAYQSQLATIGIPEADWENYIGTAEEVYYKLRGDSQSSTQYDIQSEGRVSDNRINLRMPGKIYGSLWN